MNVFLIGYRGSGKTVSGGELAGKLNFAHVDLDEIISSKAKLSIAEIFSKHGEPEFREMERNALTEAAARNGQVVSTGGGVVLNPKNVELMRERGIIVYLDCDPGVAADRIKADPNTKTQRPKLSGADMRTEVRNKMRERAELYESAADFKHDTSRQTPAEVARAILKLLVDEGGLDLVSESDYTVTGFSKLVELKPVRMSKGARVREEQTGNTYRVNPFLFCDSCASATSVLVRLEGSPRFRCVQCGEWIKAEKIADSEYEFYLPLSWGRLQRKKWYEAWKMRRTIHLETRRLFKEYIGAFEEPAPQPGSGGDFADEIDIDSIPSPKLSAHYMRTQESGEFVPPETGSETAAPPTPPAHTSEKRSAEESQIVDLTPSGAYDPTGITAPPGQTSSEDSQIVDLTPTGPFDPATITAPPQQGQQSGKPGKKSGRTQITRTASQPSTEEEAESPDQAATPPPPEPQEPSADPGPRKGKHKPTRIIRADQVAQDPSAEKETETPGSPFDEFDEKWKRTHPPKDDEG
jgi:shikimate kinase